MAGYSAKSLGEKLGLVSARLADGGRKALFLAAPPDYGRLLGKLPSSLACLHSSLAKAAGKSLARQAPFDFIQAFCRSEDELKPLFPVLKGLLATDGMLWISWPKAIKGRKPAAGGPPAPGGLQEGRVREIGLSGGLVDVKVCAVDEIWSGLKFVYRIADRNR